MHTHLEKRVINTKRKLLRKENNGTKLPIRVQLPKNFFKEEVRCGHATSTQMKKVWAVELDLLNEVNRICTKYNLTYYADGGTLLGAVRHNGYIPWDDDIDLSMMRSDYDKFCEVAQEELQYPYFLSTEHTEKGVLRGHAQVRNSATTAIISGHLEKNILLIRVYLLIYFHWTIFPLKNKNWNNIKVIFLSRYRSVVF